MNISSCLVKNNKIFSNNMKNEIGFDTLINWANALECRDDLVFKNEAIQEFIFELANPEINGDITKERLQEIVNELQVQSPD